MRSDKERRSRRPEPRRAELNASVLRVLTKGLRDAKEEAWEKLTASSTGTISSHTIGQSSLILEEDCVRTFCATVPAPEAAGFLVFFFYCFFCVCVLVPWCMGSALLSEESCPHPWPWPRPQCAKWWDPDLTSVIGWLVVLSPCIKFVCWSPDRQDFRIWLCTLKAEPLNVRNTDWSLPRWTGSIVAACSSSYNRRSW